MPTAIEYGLMAALITAGVIAAGKYAFNTEDDTAQSQHDIKLHNARLNRIRQLRQENREIAAIPDLLRTFSSAANQIEAGNFEQAGMTTACFHAETLAAVLPTPAERDEMTENAKQYCAKAVSLYPENTDFSESLAVVSSDAAFEDYHNMNPTEYRYGIQLRHALHEMGRPDEAVSIERKSEFYAQSKISSVALTERLSDYIDTQYLDCQLATFAGRFEPDPEVKEIAIEDGIELCTHLRDYFAEEGSDDPKMPETVDLALRRLVLSRSLGSLK